MYVYIYRCTHVLSKLLLSTQKGAIYICMYIVLPQVIKKPSLGVRLDDEFDCTALTVSRFYNT